MDLMDLSARDLASRIRRKEVTPVEAVQSALARMEARRDLNAFITETADLALATARAAEDKVMRGDVLPPLHGVPYSVKDLTATAGVRTTMGSFIHENHVPDYDAVAVARAKAAGAILIGKTTTPEYGHKPYATAPIFGRTYNPVNRDYTPGASSSGAAVAVAAGMGPLALGTDGGGSIRIPASCCGIVGMKPTLGAIPHLQAPDLYSPNSYVGPMARDVADTALFFDVLEGLDRGDPYGQAGKPTQRPAPLSLKGLRVAWLPTAGNPVDPEVAAITERAVRELERAGAIVETVFIDFVALEKHFLVIHRASAAGRIGTNLEKFRDRIDPTLVEAVLQGRELGAVAVMEAGYARTEYFRKLERILATADVLISPTLSAPPMHIDTNLDGEVEIAGQAAGTVRAAWYPYTYPMNLTGHPALSMPCGHNSKGLPIGLQLCGRWHDDRYLLGVAHLVEQTLAG
ncbi:Amidase [Bordetella sputigena]|uniref:amidase n=1 Tax=Bordetella sputigena TaxID=1416810 RepID=UPI0039EF6E60